MDLQFTGLSEQVFLSVNGSLIFLNLTVNIFYLCCLIYLAYSGRTLKQPLKILLGFFVCFSIMHFVFLPIMCGVSHNVQSAKVLVVLILVFLHCVHYSMTFSVWLNFYYYIQIVPLQRALLIWVKRNIKSVIYTAMLVDGTLFSLGGSLVIGNVILQPRSKLPDINGTWTDHRIYYLSIASRICFFIVQIHTLVYLCVMMVSSFSTVHFLHCHIRRMRQKGSFLSTARLQGQIRVSITGIFQGVLSCLYGLLFLANSLNYIFSRRFFFSPWVYLTVNSVYLSGTTVILGLGQTAFRQRAVDVWKALKAQWGVSMVTSDVNISSCHHTSGERPYTVHVPV